MQNCEFVTFISVLACTIAKDKTEDELNILSAFFTQLRRYSSNFIYTISYFYIDYLRLVHPTISSV